MSCLVRKRDIRVYTLAKSFLLKKSPPQITKDRLESYMEPPLNAEGPTELSDVFLRLLVSLQNSQMKKNIIGGSIDGIQNLDNVLFGFDVSKVTNHYGMDNQRLLDNIIRELKPGGQLLPNRQGLWPKYCRSVLEAAEFLKGFDDGEAFHTWAKFLCRQKASFAALPLILEKEIYGLGFSLACDFLKAVGFVNYGKPDVHITRIFEETGLAPIKSRPYDILKAIRRVAENADKTAYAVDKTFWLIGSGYYYLHKEDIGDNGHTRSLRNAFIEHCQADLPR